ncbi:MAG: peptidoglycan-binding protein [Syntrophomonas sp.]
MEKNKMAGPDVLALQKRLAELGYSPGALDGIFGQRTEEAVIRLQKARGLQADGIVDPDTWNSLEIVPVQNPKVMDELNDSQTRILIDTIKKKLTFSSNTLNKIYPVAVGKPSTPTPLGNWTIVQKAMNPGGPFGARWMRLSVPWGGYGIHGTNRPSSIGTAASHGCIRMYNADVIEIYPLTPIGTPVTITGRAYSGRVLKLGDKGNDVKELQQMLRTLGYYQNKADGYFGKKTEQAVINLQQDNGVTADGIVGPVTFNALQKAYDLATKNYEP